MSTRRTFSAAIIVLSLLFPVVLASSAIDPVGDSDGIAAHDILAADVTDYPDSVLFIPTMAGLIRQPVSGSEQFEILFTVATGATYDPAADTQVGMAYRIWLVRPPEAPTYQLGHAAAGDADPSILLTPQPASGRDTAIFQVKKVHIPTLHGLVPAPGDWIADISVRYLANGVVVDSLELPDHPLAPLGGGLELYPVSDGDVDLHPHEPLITESPQGDVATTRLIGPRTQFTAEWSSEPLAQPFRLSSMASYVWISATTATPVAALNWIDVKVYEEAEGFRNLLGRRLEYRFGENTNVPIVPGAPQQIGFFLAADATTVREGARIVLNISVEAPPGGNAYMQSPGFLIHYGSAQHATQLHLDGTFFTPPPPAPLRDVRADVARPVLGDVAITWVTDAPGTSVVRYGPAGAPLDLVATGDAGTAHRVLLTGLGAAASYSYRVETETAEGTLVSDTFTFTTPRDLSGRSHAVVAIVNSGINPYHERFLDPNLTGHPATFLTGYPASTEPVHLTLDASSFGDAAMRDAAAWHAMLPGVPVFFPGTRVIAAVDFDHHNPYARANDLTNPADTQLNMDAANEGTAIATAIISENPDALLAIVKNGGTQGIRWAAQQPYVDVIDIGFWHNYLLDEGPAALHEAVSLAYANGKIVTSAAGDLIPGYLVDDLDGGTTGYAAPLPPPDAIVTSSWSAVWTGEAAEGGRFKDVVNLFVVGLTPLVNTIDDYYSTSGANRASGRTAGILSNLILELRRVKADVEEGASDGALVNGAGGGAFTDGRLTNGEIRHFVNMTASTYGPLEWTPQIDCIFSVLFCGADVPTTPAYWLQVGWGFASRATIPQIVRIAEGKLPVPDKPIAEDHMAAMYAARVAYYESHTRGAAA